MGASPWLSEQNDQSPEGTKDAVPFALSGLNAFAIAIIHGLAPMATAFRPFGTKILCTPPQHQTADFDLSLAH
jgi:hypothetical protein